MPTEYTLAAACAVPGRVAVWANPEHEGAPLDRRDLVNGYNRNRSYGWTWWSARHIVLLPASMTLHEALLQQEPVEVTAWGDVDPLDSGLNEVHERFDVDWSSHKPEQVHLNPDRLLQEVGRDDYTSLRLMRDIHRREHGMGRAVLRSDDYGRSPHHVLAHDWPDGLFIQGGKVRRDDKPEVFLEAFPTEPSTFIRAEGNTLTDAEEALWRRWQQITGCEAVHGKHHYEQRGYRNGAGICAHCGLFTSDVFDLEAIGSVCVICAAPTYWQTCNRRNPDRTWVKGEIDLVCKDHALPNYLDYSDATHALRNGRPIPVHAGGPDLSWLEGYLSLDEHGNDSEAFRHAIRDLLDARIAAHRAANTTEEPHA